MKIFDEFGDTIDRLIIGDCWDDKIKNVPNVVWNLVWNVIRTSSDRTISAITDDIYNFSKEQL